MIGCQRLSLVHMQLARYRDQDLYLPAANSFNNILCSFKNSVLCVYFTYKSGYRRFISVHNILTVLYT